MFVSECVAHQPAAMSSPLAVTRDHSPTSFASTRYPSRVAAPRFPRFLTAMLCASLLAGCGTFRSYRAEMDETLSRAASGDVAGAIKVVEKNNSLMGGKDLLYHMELGELKRMAGDYEGSFAALSAADAELIAWEQASRLDPDRVTGQVASYLLNDRVRTYEGHDYEKVMVTTRMAMDHLARGDWDNARVEIKRTHEREAFISELRTQEYLKVQEEAKRRGVDPSFKEIGGYPVHALETPEALSLRNSYQNALSHYLAGFVYEALGEIGLSAPGYRKAIELKPGQPLLEQALAGLDERSSAADDGTCDMLMIIETGAIPGRISQNFNLPIPILAYGTFVTMPISFPILPPPPMAYQAPDVQVDRNGSVPTAHVLDLDAVARRALKEEMPSIMLRAFIRASSKAVAQYQLQQQMAQRNRKQNDGGLGAALALLAVQIGGVIVEQADERGWRMLPEQVSIARVRIPRGQHAVDIRTESGTAGFQVNVTGRHALVSVRLLRGQSFASPATSPGGATTPPPAQSTRFDGESGQPLYARTEVIEFPHPLPPPRRTAQ